ncbi:MAG: hypothetical protein M1826_004174 [Phylliscum demangeonii]|nr:MAG: hypothetical protein M1826_004174 [Phylliscum demangeonii]
MPYMIALPTDIGYVALTAMSSIALTGWMTLWVGSYRRLAKLPYPAAYASMEAAKTDAKLHTFNCAQRAHANTLEAYPGFLVSLVLGGLQFPKVAAALGMAWIVSRVMYANGYTSGKPGDEGAGRRVGSWGLVPLVGLYALAAYVTFGMLVLKL